MQNDEQAIRDLIADWQSAAETGDVERLRTMLAEDVIFLTPGQPPLYGRQTFLNAFQEGLKHYRIESQAEIKEIHVAADFAYCWTQLSVTVTPYQQGLPMRRSGNVLSILKIQDARWVIVRDANLLTSQPANVPT
jgi:uncharacterized protein (TIGR02246 family)